MLSCLSVLQDFHTKYLAATVAVVLIIGPFFMGHLRPDNSMRGRASMLSNMRYHTSVIIALFSSLGSLASSSRKLMKLGAYADRIVGLQDVVKDVSHGTPPTFPLPPKRLILCCGDPHQHLSHEP